MAETTLQIEGSSLLPSHAQPDITPETVHAVQVKSMATFTVVLLLLAAAAVAASPECDIDWTFYPDLEGTEEGAQPQFSGSCVKLFKTTDQPFVLPNPFKSFAVSANDFCGIMHSGGRLLSFSSLSPSSNGMLAFAKNVIASAGTPLVLIGGEQNPNAIGTPKYLNWIWTDFYTDPSIINMSPSSVGNNWGPGEPK